MTKASIILCLVFSGAAFGSLELVTGDLAVELSPGRSWTLLTMYKSGRSICDYLGSSQGTVLYIDGEWAGSGHQNEELLEARVFVDGAEQTVEDGLSYNGEVIKFVRRTRIGNAYALTSIMTIRESHTNEYIIFKGLDDSKICTIFYGFLGSRANRLIDYIAYDGEGALLWSGTTNQDDGTNTILWPAVAVAQYDPNLGDGVCSIVKIGGDLAANNVISDRAEDNKLYTWFHSVEGPADPGKYFSIDQELVFFEAEMENWADVTSDVVANHAHCPSADAASIHGDVRDCRDDFFDFAALAQDWSDSGSVDYSDLRILTSQWLDYNLERAEVCLE